MYSFPYDDFQYQEGIREEAEKDKDKEYDDAFNCFSLDKSTASEDALKKAYRKEVLLSHPDKNIGKEVEAQEKFAKVKRSKDLCDKFFEEHRKQAPEPSNKNYEANVPRPQDRHEDPYTGGHGFERRSTTTRKSYAYPQTEPAPPRRSGTAYGSYSQPPYGTDSRSYANYSGPSYTYPAYPGVPQYTPGPTYATPKPYNPNMDPRGPYRAYMTPSGHERPYYPEPRTPYRQHRADDTGDLRNPSGPSGGRMPPSGRKQTYPSESQTHNYQNYKPPSVSDDESDRGPRGRARARRSRSGHEQAYTPESYTPPQDSRHDSGSGRGHRGPTQAGTPSSRPNRTAPSGSRATPPQDRTHDSPRVPAQAGNPSSRSNQTAPPDRTRGSGSDRKPEGESKAEQKKKNTGIPPDLRERTRMPYTNSAGENFSSGGGEKVSGFTSERNPGGGSQGEQKRDSDTLPIFETNRMIPITVAREILGGSLKANRRGIRIHCRDLESPIQCHIRHPILLIVNSPLETKRRVPVIKTREVLEEGLLNGCLLQEPDPLLPLRRRVGDIRLTDVFQAIRDLLALIGMRRLRDLRRIRIRKGGLRIQKGGLLRIPKGGLLRIPKGGLLRIQKSRLLRTRLHVIESTNIDIHKLLHLLRPRSAQSRRTHRGGCFKHAPQDAGSKWESWESCRSPRWVNRAFELLIRRTFSI